QTVWPTPSIVVAIPGSTNLRVAVDSTGYGVADWTTPGGGSVGGGVQAATWTPAPTVTNVNPNSGPQAGGNTVTITGTNFQNATQVAFGGKNALSFTVVSRTEITATVPSGTGTVDVTVTTPAGTSL